MTLFDGILILILGVSVFFAAYRGAVREFTTLICLGLAAFIAWITLNPILSAIGKADNFFAIIFVLSIVGLISFIALYFLSSKLTNGLKLDDRQSLIDRVIGGVFGFIRAMALVGLAFLGAGYIVDEENQPEMVREAALLPLAKSAASLIEGVAPAREPALPDPTPTGGRDVSPDADNDDNDAPVAQEEANASYDRETRNGLTQLVTTVTTTDQKKADDLTALAATNDPIAALAKRERNEPDHH